MKKLSQSTFNELSHQLKEEVRAGSLTIQQATKKIRKLMGMNQDEFAEFTHISPRTFKEFERGNGNPTLNTLRKIGGVFSLDVKFSPFEQYPDKGKSAKKKWRKLMADARD